MIADYQLLFPHVDDDGGDDNDDDYGDGDDDDHHDNDDTQDCQHNL